MQEILKRQEQMHHWTLRELRKKLSGNQENMNPAEWNHGNNLGFKNRSQ